MTKREAAAEAHRGYTTPEALERTTVFGEHRGSICLRQKSHQARYQIWVGIHGGAVYQPILLGSSATSWEAAFTDAESNLRRLHDELAIVRASRSS